MVVSVVLGGGICLVANSLSALWIFRPYEARRPERLLLRIYGAEVMKLAVIIGLFGTAFAHLDDLVMPALLASYLFVQVASAPIAAQFASPQQALAPSGTAPLVAEGIERAAAGPTGKKPNRQDQNRELTDVDR